MKKRRSYFDKICDDCSDIWFELSLRIPEDPEERLDQRYRMTVMAILPMLLRRTRALLLLLCFPAGFFLGMLAAAIYCR